MKRFPKIILIICLSVAYLVMFVLPSCVTLEDYPPEPEIKFKSYSHKDTLDKNENHVLAGILKFSFTDGDGDIGLNEGDTVPPHPACKDSTCNNLYVNRIIIKDGVSIASIPYNFRIPVITPTGQNKALIGEIDVELNISLPAQIIIDFNTIPYDTVIYELYIYDRALHQSNTITTPRIVLNN